MTKRLAWSGSIRSRSLSWLLTTSLTDLQELFSRSSVLSLHCPLTKQTRNLVSHRLISLLPPSAILINTSRGEVVDLDAVESALKSEKLAGAALDVLPDVSLISVQK